MNPPTGRPRLLSMLGWMHVILGLYLPASIALPLPSAWFIMQHYKQVSRPLYFWSIAETVVLGAMSVVAGILLLGRRPVAPLIVTLAATAILIDAVSSLYSWGESNVRLIAMISGESKYSRVAANYAAMLILDGFRVGCSLVTLGMLGRQTVRDELAWSRPELTAKSLWSWIGVSTFVAVLFKAWLWVVGWVTYE